MMTPELKLEPTPEPSLADVERAFEISKMTAYRKRWSKKWNGTFVWMRDGTLVFIHGKHLNRHYTLKDDLYEAVDMLFTLFPLVMIAFAFGVCKGLYWTAVMAGF